MISMTEYRGHPDQYFGCITYSQHGEDLMILNLFKQIGVDRPSYLDLGAHHPSDIANTRLLYERGCRGVNVEANPSLIEAFIIERPEDVNVNAGVGFSYGQELFYMYDDRSGRNTFSKKEVERFEAQSDFRVKKVIKLMTLPLSAIIKKYCNGIFPDFLNCDIEGMDYRILEQVDFFAS